VIFFYASRLGISIWELVARKVVKIGRSLCVECEVTKSNAQLEKDQWSLRASTRLAMEIGGPSVEESSNETHALCCGHSPSSK